MQNFRFFVQRVAGVCASVRECASTMTLLLLRHSCGCLMCMHVCVCAVHIYAYNWVDMPREMTKLCCGLQFTRIIPDNVGAFIAWLSEFLVWAEEFPCNAEQLNALS